MRGFLKNIIQSLFPSTTPFLVTIRVGANVWNQYGTIPAGSIDANFPQPVTVGAYLGDKFKITSPVWSNGKPFTVLQSDCTLYEAPPPPPPTEPPAGAIPFQVSTGKQGYTAIIESNIDGVVTGRFEPNS